MRKLLYAALLAPLLSVTALAAGEAQAAPAPVSVVPEARAAGLLQPVQYYYAPPPTRWHGPPPRRWRPPPPRHWHRPPPPPPRWHRPPPPRYGYAPPRRY
ncbi:hypothetical protein MVG78_04825 [Roseomonas gilardii subsp. gilardii]|uniref:hypothetical protein n=1 Tax=Roseomonas gilardii TaxID=257708 RepID=UPI001FF958DB|nr:hypothetical protein [Roseomonas gilardii]UPG73482.1 hypothetical protein MVG78_04825 [Roseomonas gilardii subsp. gilardii]